MLPAAPIKSREIFIAAPPDALVHAGTYHAHRRLPMLLCMHALEYRSDTADQTIVRRSDDGGRSWQEIDRINSCAPRPEGGYLHRHVFGPHVDPHHGLCVQLSNEAVMPSNQWTYDAMGQTRLRYSVREEGFGRLLHEDWVIHQGEGYDQWHPLPDVSWGGGCVMIGDLGCRPIVLRDGTLVVPVQITPPGSDGKPYNPLQVMTYTESAVLRGRWCGTRIEWRLSQRVAIDTAVSPRGLMEACVAQLRDGRLLMVSRGSNTVATTPPMTQRPPGHKWASWSSDGGMTWTAPKPWTDTDGQTFFSPSSCHQLLPLSDGRILWFGNVCPQNPIANQPRYPMVMAQVDPHSGLIVAGSMRVVDDRQEGEWEQMTLSNFLAREDRDRGEVWLHMARWGAQPPADGEQRHYRADSLLYRIAL